MIRIVALVPAFNEQDRITRTVEGLLRAVEGVEVVVVDDGSDDDTVLLATAAGASIISLGRNLGKGDAVNEAFARLNPADDDILLLIDADLEETATEAAKLIGPLLDGAADMVIAVFGKPRKKGGFGLVKGLARWGIRLFGGLEVRAPLSGQRALRAGLLRAVGGFDPGYGMETGLTIDALRRGFKVIEVRTDMTHNETGRDIAGFKHRGRQFLAVARVLIVRLFGRSR